MILETSTCLRNSVNSCEIVKLVKTPSGFERNGFVSKKNTYVCFVKLYKVYNGDCFGLVSREVYQFISKKELDNFYRSQVRDYMELGFK